MRYSKLIVLTLVLVLLAALFAACEQGDPAVKAASGVYVGQYTKLVGDGDDARNTDADFRLTLTQDGKGTHERDDLSLNVTWTLEGERITVQETFIGVTLDYSGTLKDGELHLFNGDPENVWTVEYVYKKQ